MKFLEKNTHDLVMKKTLTKFIDVVSWSKEIEPHQEGKREKNKVYCPNDINFPLIPNHLYIFKQSSHNFPAQFWVEIIAFRLGCLMEISVPPAFVAIDSNREIAGALIEWFYNYPDKCKEEYMHGGDLFLNLMPEYTREGKKNNQHNINDLIGIIEKEGVTDWCKGVAEIFCFDALIGNTDRHQDNWGLVRSNNTCYFSPAYDNGTAMGHEILEENIKSLEIERYISNKKATHHIKWARNGEKIKHFELLKMMIKKWPNMIQHIKRCMEFSMDAFDAEIKSLIKINDTLDNSYDKFRLTLERANFIFKLIKSRKEEILKVIKTNEIT